MSTSTKKKGICTDRVGNSSHTQPLPSPSTGPISGILASEVRRDSWEKGDEGARKVELGIGVLRVHLGLDVRGETKGDREDRTVDRVHTCAQANKYSTLLYGVPGTG